MREHKLKLNGKEVTPAEFHRDGPVGARGVPMVTTTYTDAKPLISDGMGCMKSQVPELRDTIRRHGIQGARVLSNGQIQFTSRRARREVLRVRGLCDSDGGYSDG